MLWAISEAETKKSDENINYVFDSVLAEVKAENKRLHISRQKRKELLATVKTDSGIRKGDYSQAYIKNLILRLL